MSNGIKQQARTYTIASCTFVPREKIMAIIYRNAGFKHILVQNDLKVPTQGYYKRWDNPISSSKTYCLSHLNIKLLHTAGRQRKLVHMITLIRQIISTAEENVTPRLCYSVTRSCSLQHKHLEYIVLLPTLSNSLHQFIKSCKYKCYRRK